MKQTSEVIEPRNRPPSDPAIMFLGTLIVVGIVILLWLTVTA